MLSNRIAKLERIATDIVTEAGHCPACHDGHVARVVDVAFFRDGAQKAMGIPGNGPYDADGKCQSCGHQALPDYEALGAASIDGGGYCDFEPDQEARGGCGGNARTGRSLR